jgi:hypothetical protein
MMLLYGLTFDARSLLTDCNGTQSGFLMPNEYIKIDRLLSLLLTAKARGSSMTVNGLDVPVSC